jgi:hypothetical protein
MKRLAMTRWVLAAVVASALLVPTAMSAQSPAPAASPMAESSAAPMASPALVGVDTMDVCLSITGPVILLTPESLTQGIIDGTFVIDGLSDACEPMAAASPAAAMPSAAASAAP